MLTLHMLRHGDTLQSAEGFFCGDLNPPLADSGVEQAKRVAERLKGFEITSMYVSPKLRARMTAEPIAMALGLEATFHEGLREIGYGSWEGRQEKDIKASEPDAYAAWTADPALASPPGGESAFAIAARALPVILEIRASHPTGNVLIVSHKATIRVITCALLGMPLGRFRDRVACPTASLTTFEFGARGAMLVRIGEQT